MTSAAARELKPHASVYVAVPPDGRFGTKLYAGSGQIAARMIADAFSRRVNRVERAADIKAPEAALTEARARGADYVISPTILRWEDRATRWSGMPDVVEIRLVAVETASGNAADSAVIRGRGDRENPIGARPEDLLPTALQGYLDRLLAEPAVALRQHR